MSPTAFPLIEPLESRIAPAVIQVGNPNGSDTQYNDAPFAPTNGNANILAAIGPSANTFFLKIFAGDKVQLFNIGSGFEDFVALKSGSAILFFVDNGDNIVQGGELTGISLGKNAGLSVKGAINGDVISNLDGNGNLVANGLVSSAQSIKSIGVTGGSVVGSIVAGGKIQKVSVSGNVEAILNGSAANGYVYDFNGAVAGGGQALLVTAANGEKGQDISKVNVGSVSGTLVGLATKFVEAAGGGAGGKGGSLSGIVTTADTNGLILQAGAGGSGVAGFTKGGAGGSIKSVFIQGPNANATDATDNDAISVLGGAGGNAFAGSGDKGGSGGKLAKVFVGFASKNGNPIRNDNLLRDNVNFSAGAGGTGKIGGAGGTVIGVKIVSAAPDNAAVQDEILVAGGAGGASSEDGGKAGKGGLVKSVDARDLNINLLQARTADVHIVGGQGGGGSALRSGGSGGAVSKLTLTGFELQIDAGDGQNGKRGGNGGLVKTLTVLEDVSGVINNYTSINAGQGGDSAAGNGAKGGSISKVRIFDADFNNDAGTADTNGLSFNSGTNANGGAGTNGKGGAGGKVSDVLITDTGGQNEANLALRSGQGGAGSARGGSGGGIVKFSFSAIDVVATATAGNGGSSTGGAGGAGGSLNNVSILSTGLVAGNNVAGTATAGSGGASTAVGAGGKGGSGGKVSKVNLIVDGNAAEAAGLGGGGMGGASGKGGGVSKSSVNSVLQNATMTAGNAGATGAKGGTGGSIVKSSVLGTGDVTITGGNGAVGGRGGDLKNLTYSGGIVATAPTGTVTVDAGDGSAAGTTAGKGGSMVKITGYVGGAGNTSITAGTGGGVATKGAAGGSIIDATILGGGGATAVFTIAAGDAGDSASAAKGAKGGSIVDFKFRGDDPTTAAVEGVTADTILRSIAAGDGGDAVSGGTGGSLKSLAVQNHDIGVRSGANFGFATMGGLFAGAGGAGGGAAGSVINVSADTIAAIVAGKAAIPKLVTKVDRIFLNGLNRTILVPDGGDANYDAYDVPSYATANLVGAAANPGAADAAKFHFTNNGGGVGYDPTIDTPIDGLIAALTITNKRNFTPGALVTGPANADFFDYNV